MYLKKSKKLYPLLSFKKKKRCCVGPSHLFGTERVVRAAVHFG